MADKKQNAARRSKRSLEPEWIDLNEDFLEEGSLEDDNSDNDSFHENTYHEDSLNDAPYDDDTLEEDSFDEDFSDENDWEEEEKKAKRSPEKAVRKKKKVPEKKKAKLNFHVILLAAIALVFAVIAFKLIFWDSRTHQNSDLENDSTLSFDTEALDNIVPLDASNPGQKETDDDLRILFVGNGSLADQKESDTNLANIVQKKTGATVYNCAIPGSYMSMKNPTYISTDPYDALSFYYLSTLFALGNTVTLSWAERDLGGLPSEVKEATDLLQSIDYNELDVLCIYYDGSDYLEQRSIRDTDNESNVNTFCGALNAGIGLIKDAYPGIRIIVMSPTYLYVTDQDGNYTSPYSTAILSEPFTAYIGFEAQTCVGQNISFVDNLYGSIYEEIADQYLKDDILLNEKGHELLADRFLYALNRFNDYDF